ncbi:MAG: hypothetical protein WKF47_07495 [Geodermatophilaceae bacterium]
MRLHGVLGVRAGGSTPPRELDVDLAVIVRGIVAPAEWPSTTLGSSRPAVSTNTFSGLSEKTLGPGPTGELLALTAQELPAKRTVRGPASDRAFIDGTPPVHGVCR